MPKYKLSFIATSRNDNHGGNMKAKNNFFVNSWVNQVNKLNLSAELILVEWNPPEDELRLKEEIKLKFDLHPGAQIKIITVPREIHKQYIYSDKINLYQMIAKNVGIKRSDSEFIICTNTDILFSKKLLNEINELSQKNKNIIYRADRHDIDLDNFNNYEIDEKKFYNIKTVINTKYYSHDLLKNKKYYVNRSLKNYIFNFIPTLRFIFFTDNTTNNKMILNLRKITSTIINSLIKIKSRSIFSYNWKYIITRTLPRKLFGFTMVIIYPIILLYSFLMTKIKGQNYSSKFINKISNIIKNSFIFFIPFKEAFSIIMEKN